MQKILIANWKENPETEREALALYEATARASTKKKADVVVCPPFVYLEQIAGRMKRFKKKRTPSVRAGTRTTFPLRGEGNLALGAQDVFWEESGPHTGEIGPKMLKQFGVRYVIIGHSERRWLGETDEMINQKVVRALKSGLRVILCVGESALVRRKGFPAAKQFVASQLKKDLKGLGSGVSGIGKKLIVAYEPIWAIGTGRNDPPEDALAMAIFIKKKISSLLAIPYTLYPIPVLYGGSVDDHNVQDYVQYDEIDGALVGGASLKANEFKSMIDVVSDLENK